MPRRLGPALLLAAPLLAGCGGGTPPESRIAAEAIRADLKALAADDMEGRKPGTPGGDRAAHYIAARFREAGLAPAVAGDYLQPVPMIGIAPAGEPALAFGGGAAAGRRALGYRDEFVAWTRALSPEVRLRAPEVVFAGYGITAPEEGWDDYAGLDARGKLLLLLVNEPASDDPGFFDGAALTYYGRWTYKLEEAGRRGAAGALLIHTDDSAGYPWSVVEASWTGEQFYLAAGADPAASLVLSGWLSQGSAEAIAAAAGEDLAEWISAAGRRGFSPRRLQLPIEATIRSKVRRFESPNVIGLRRGTDGGDGAECVLYTSHYDHLGVGGTAARDSIYNGARDNASGVATLLALAGAFVAAAPPRRSVVFAAVTAEEAGVLGSTYYADHPVCPLARTAAAINLDSINVWGPTRDIIPLGADRAGLGASVAAVAARMGMQVAPDPAPEKGFLFRSDQFSLARRGVPAVYLDSGVTFLDRPPGWGERMEEDYTTRDYHRPSDDYRPEWPLSGAEQMGRFAYLLGREIADAGGALPLR